MENDKIRCEIHHICCHLKLENIEQVIKLY
jgi:hypothetical protein